MPIGAQYAVQHNAMCQLLSPDGNNPLSQMHQRIRTTIAFFFLLFLISSNKWFFFISTVVSSGNRVGLISTENKAVCSPFLLCYCCRKTALRYKYFRYGVGTLADEKNPLGSSLSLLTLLNHNIAEKFWS